MRSPLRALDAPPHRDRLCLIVIGTGLLALDLSVPLQVLWLLAVAGSLLSIGPLERAVDTLDRERLP